MTLPSPASAVGQLADRLSSGEGADFSLVNLRSALADELVSLGYPRNLADEKAESWAPRLEERLSVRLESLWMSEGLDAPLEPKFTRDCPDFS